MNLPLASPVVVLGVFHGNASNGAQLYRCFHIVNHSDQFLRLFASLVLEPLQVRDFLMILFFLEIVDEPVEVVGENVKLVVIVILVDCCE